MILLDVPRDVPHKQRMRKESILCKCGNLRASKSRWCLSCKRDYMREWRKSHPLSEVSRKRANARSYAHVYLKRGKIHKSPCEVCGRKEVEGHHDDYRFPLKIRWLCKFHHLKLHGKLA